MNIALLIAGGSGNRMGQDFSNSGSMLKRMGNSFAIIRQSIYD